MMSRKALSWFSLGLFLVLVAGYNNCGTDISFSKLYGSTSIGNPMTQASEEILFALCSVLNRSQARVPMNVCTSGVLATNGIGAQLGLAPGIDDPYSAVENAENSGSISANANQANTCVDTINNLNPSDPNVINAYNPALPNPFAGVPNMIPAQCNQVFTPLTSQIVQWNNNEAGHVSSMTITNLNPQSSGNTNLVWVSFASPTSSVTSVVDSAGNTYAPINPTNPQSYENLWYASNIKSSAAGANTITATFNQVDVIPEITMLEAYGLGTLDTAAENGTVAPTYTASVTTSQANETLFCFNYSGSKTVTISSPFSFGWNTLNSNLFGEAFAPTPGAYTCAGTDTGAATTEVVAFKNNGTSNPPISLKQIQGNWHNTATHPITMVAPQTAGDLNIVSVTWEDSAHIITGVSDSAGNTYSLVTNVVGTNESGAIYYATGINAAAGGANTVTINFSGVVAASQVNVFEYSGVSALDQFNHAFGTTNLATTGNVNTSFPNEVVVTILGEDNSADAYRVSGSFRILFPSMGTSGFGGIEDYPADQIVSTSGTYGNTFSLSSSVDWVGLIASFH